MMFREQLQPDTNASGSFKTFLKNRSRDSKCPRHLPGYEWNGVLKKQRIRFVGDCRQRF